METNDNSVKKPSKTVTISGSVCFVLSILMALWFGLTSWVWYGGANLIFSYPAGMFSLLLWALGKEYDPDVKRYKLTLAMLITGLISSISVLIVILAVN